MNRQPQQPSQQDSVPRAINIIALVAQTLAVSVEVFVRLRIGSRYLDKQAALAVLAIPGFGLFWPEHDLRPLMWYLAAYCFACAVVRARSLRRRIRGQEDHTRYSGWPWLLNLRPFRRVSEQTAKAGLEPILVCLGGGLVTTLNVPLGAHLMVAAVGLFVSEALRRGYEQQRLMNLRDQLSDQRRMAEQFRHGRW